MLYFVNDLIALTDKVLILLVNLKTNGRRLAITWNYLTGMAQTKCSEQVHARMFTYAHAYTHALIHIPKHIHI